MSESSIFSNETSGEAIARVRKGIDDITASAAQNAGAARDALKESYQTAKQVVAKGTQAAKTANGYVEAHPWVAVGVGIAVGVLIGAMARRR
jgi:ElaB/YqjD/DUF883 family membrane-anchored ribosome-binding protein